MDGLIPRNVTEAVKAPRPEKKEIEPLSPEQARVLLATVSEAGERFEALYVLAVSTGMRQGELLGLKWEDVDFDAGTLQVRRTLSTATGGGFRFGAPKTAKSRRSIRLPGMALSALRRHRKAQLEERMKLAGLFVDHGMVFTSRAGTPVMRQDLITRSFKPLLKRGGTAGHPFPRSPPHLRHPAARQGRTRQARAGAVGTFDHLHHAGHLQPRAARHGRCGGRGDG